jgi:hypothetical protein
MEISTFLMRLGLHAASLTPRCAAVRSRKQPRLIKRRQIPKLSLLVRDRHDDCILLGASSMAGSGRFCSQPKITKRAVVTPLLVIRTKY